MENNTVTYHSDCTYEGSSVNYIFVNVVTRHILNGNDIITIGGVKSHGIKKTWRKYRYLLLIHSFHHDIAICCE